MQPNLRIVLVSSSLTMGGAERVLSIMANYWARTGADVVLITFSRRESDFYALDSRIKRITLNGLQASSSSWSALKNNALRALRLRSAVKNVRPDFIISFLPRPNVLTILASRSLSIPVVISERSNPSRQKLGKTWTWLRQRVYPSATAVVAQTSEAKDIMMAYVPEHKIRTIPNPVQRPSLSSEAIAEISVSRPFILAMGRFVPEKGFDLLLKAFAKSRSKQGFGLVILGDGPERHNLQSLAESLGISEQVHLPGPVQDPIIICRQASFFVLSSRFEGFPNALLEAMSLGVPVVSFDCPNGPRRLVDNEVNGLLVPPEDIDAMSAAMDRLMDDESERHRLGSNARAVVNEFSLENVMGKWNALIEEFDNCRRRSR